MSDLKDVNWLEKEDSRQIRRPFVVKIEESTAKDFIEAIHSVPGLFVRETVVKLMRVFTKFVKEGGLKNVGQGDVEAVRGRVREGKGQGSDNGS